MRWKISRVISDLVCFAENQISLNFREKQIVFKTSQRSIEQNSYFQTRVGTEISARNYSVIFISYPAQGDTNKNAPRVGNQSRAPLYRVATVFDERTNKSHHRASLTIWQKIIFCHIRFIVMNDCHRESENLSSLKDKNLRKPPHISPRTNCGFETKAPF